MRAHQHHGSKAEITIVPAGPVNATLMDDKHEAQRAGERYIPNTMWDDGMVQKIARMLVFWSLLVKA